MDAERGKSSVIIIIRFPESVKCNTRMVSMVIQLSLDWHCQRGILFLRWLVVHDTFRPYAGWVLPLALSEGDWAQEFVRDVAATFTSIRKGMEHHLVDNSSTVRFTGLRKESGESISTFFSCDWGRATLFLLSLKHFRFLGQNPSDRKKLCFDFGIRWPLVVLNTLANAEHYCYWEQFDNCK